MEGESILEVAKYFLSLEAMNHKKLQKLCYIAQGIHLGIKGKILMPNATFEAWIHGPVCPLLYERYKDWKGLDIYSSYSYKFKNKETERFLWKVYTLFGMHYDGDALEKFTKDEVPYINARKGHSPEEVIRVKISCKDMAEYYHAKIYGKEETYD